MLNQKTPRTKVLGVFFRRNILARSSTKTWFVCFGALFGWPVCADCPAPSIYESAVLAYVYDGDTLRLDDGRRIRVLGINSPEISVNNQPVEPLAREAQQAAKVFFLPENHVRLVYDVERQDRYGRYLAHVYNARGQSLAANMLRKGLAFQIVVPPNLAKAECLRKEEVVAQQAGVGVWQDRYWRARPVADLNLQDAGFFRLRGQVAHITEARDIWIELDGPLVIKIAAVDKAQFSDKPWRHWQGKTLEMRGWVVNRNRPDIIKKGLKPLQLRLRSPHAVREISHR